MHIFEESDDAGNKPTNKIELIKKAIREKIGLFFNYKGLDFTEKRRNGIPASQGSRYVEPAHLFTHRSTGNLILGAWQWGGVTNSTTKLYKTGNTKGGKPHWKEFLVDEMNQVQLRFSGKEDGSYEHFETPGDHAATGSITNRIDGSNPQPGKYSGASHKHAGSIDAYAPTGAPQAPAPAPETPPTTPPTAEPQAKQVTPAKDLPVQPQNKPQEPTTQTPVTPEKPQQPVVPATPQQPTPQQPAPEEEPEDDGDEWQTEEEPILESSGFFKWLINL